MATQPWPEEAREAVDAVLEAHFPRIHPGERRYAAEALIAALAPHVTPTASQAPVLLLLDNDERDDW